LWTTDRDMARKIFDLAKTYGYDLGAQALDELMVL
jgi:hypothetical protein